MKNKKNRSFQRDQLEVNYRDSNGNRIYFDKGKPDKVILGFLGKFEGLTGKIERLGLRIDKRKKTFKKLLK